MSLNFSEPCYLVPRIVLHIGRHDDRSQASVVVGSRGLCRLYPVVRCELESGNALTPEDISIKDVEIVAESFDARRDGRSRTYEYRILSRPSPSPFYLNYAWHLHDSLDVRWMRKAICCLEGEHDFSSFRASGCDAPHPTRTVYRTSLDQVGELLVFTIEATAFLRHMARNIVGTLVEVGRGLREPQSFAELLEARDRTKAGPTAPPHGLFLMEVKY